MEEPHTDTKIRIAQRFANVHDYDSCDACVDGLQVLPTLPRMDRAGKSIPSDMGTYSFLDCSIADSSLSCTFNNPFEGSGWKTSDGAPGSALQYAEGPGLYAAVAIAMALLSILFTIVFVIGRYCCLCCKRTSCVAVTFQCGGYEPTRRMCGCGAATDAKTGQVAYPRAERILTTLLLWTFLILVL